MRGTNPAFTVPVVPAASALLILVGLPMWAISTLQARADTHQLFTQLGMQLPAADDIHAGALAAVLVLTPLTLAVLTWGFALEAWGGSATASATSGSGGVQARLLGLRSYAQLSTWAAAAHWLLLLLLAFTLSGMMAWLLDAQQAQQMLGGQGGGGGGSWPPFWPPSSSTVAAAAAPTPAAAWSGAPVAAAAAALPSLPAASLGANGVVAPGACPESCVNLGAVAAALRLPLSCVCEPMLSKGLAEILGTAVQHLVPSVVGVTFMFVATSFMMLYLATQRVHAIRDEMALAAAAGQPLLGP